MRNCEEDTLDDMDESLLEPIVMVYQMSQMKESDIDEKAITAKMGTDGTQVDMKQLMQHWQPARYRISRFLRCESRCLDRLMRSDLLH